MESNFKINIPKPCHEDWNQMTPDDTGRFCGSCVKSVVDFTGMKSSEIQDYFKKHQGEKVCGRFRNEQVNDKFDLQIPQSILEVRMPFSKAFLLTLFVVMGSTLFSCKNQDDATLGEVLIVKDTVEQRTTTGVILPSKNSVDEEPVTIGKIDQKSYDSLVKAGVKIPTLPPPPPVKQVKFFKGNAKIQKKEDVEVKTSMPIQITEKDDFIYGMPGITIYPEYAGGTKKFKDFIKANYKFTKNSNRINGRLKASFVIEKNGDINDIKIIDDLGYGSGEALISVLSKSSKWYPAEYNGKKQQFHFELLLLLSNDTISRMFDKKITAKIDSVELIRITKFDH